MHPLLKRAEQLAVVGVRKPLVTTGLDPVVHADSPHVRRRRMDCRVRPGNDAVNSATIPGLQRTDD